MNIEQYKICQERGHQSKCSYADSQSEWQGCIWNVCKHCGTHYRNKIELIEINIPKE